MTGAGTGEQVGGLVRIRHRLRAGLDVPRRGLEAGYAAWRHSLQLRVATTTLVVAAVIVVVIGVFLVDKVSGGILHAKRQAAIAQARIGLSTARPILQNVDPGVVNDLANAKLQVFSSVTAGGASAGTFTITVAAPGESDQGDPALATVPDALRRAVQSGNLAVQYAPVLAPQSASATTNSPGHRPLPRVVGLIVGEPVAGRTGTFELYYFFPLTAEQQTIELVQRTVLLAGLALVVLVLAIALIVTRQVVRPVRVAAETAGLLAAGDLSQRIAVRGSDELARLGRSFNDMAGSLQRQINRLEELSRLQQRFTSDVSHELRTPLTTIRMAAEYLHGGRAEFSPELSRAAELLHTELDRFESLLADLLEISRYDAGAAVLESEPSDIRGAVTRTLEAVSALAERHGSELEVYAPEEPVSVEMDVRRVERILRNLVGNAIEHGEGKPVVITIGADEYAVAVTVRDHGLGLAPGQAPLVFNRFWRGDTSRSRITGGTGLGLAISLEDARLHDGWLQAWGQPRRGAQFRLTLPRRAGYTLMHSPLALDPDESSDDEWDARWDPDWDAE